MLRNNFRIFGRMILTVKGERADAVSSPAAPLRKGNEMFCPHCGSQQPDGAVFCGNCGQSMVGAPSAPQPAPVRQAPAPQQFAPQSAPVQQPFAQPAPAAHRGFGNAASSFQSTLTAATGFGKRSLAMLGGAVASFVCMFQPWIALPCIDKIYDYILKQASFGYSQSDYGYAGLAQAVGSLNKAFSNTSFDMPQVFGLGNALRDVVSEVNNLLPQAHLDYSTAQQAQSVLGSLGLAANVLTVFSVLWIACLAALVAGVVLKFVKKNDVVLFAGLGATAVISLVCIVASFIANGQIDSSLSTVVAAMGNNDAVALMTAIKPFLAPAYGAVLTLIFSAAGLVCSFVLKED